MAGCHGSFAPDPSRKGHYWGRRNLKEGPMQIGRRIIFSLLLIAVLVIIWNVLGPR
jgi:hypothetical protein